MTYRPDLWHHVPGLNPADGLLLLGLDRAADELFETEAIPVDDENPIEPDTVAALTGLSSARAAAGLRELAKRGLVERVYRLGDERSDGKPPSVRVAYAPNNALTATAAELGEEA